MSKYNGRRDLVRILAEYFSKELVLLNWFMDIETIIPVPIHYMRMIKRGYNQSEWLAKGISDITGITVEKRLLIKMSYNQTQTKKGHYERFENTCGVFNSRAHIAERYSNVLLVDDVLTSGSTLAACVDAIRKNSNMKISILTLGFAE
jgi:Predicted amidophosphoribosyltransferases